MTKWIATLSHNNYVKKEYIKKIKENIIEVYKLRDVDKITNNFNSEYSIHDFRLIKHKNNNIISFDIVVNDDNLSDEMIIQAISKEIRKFYKKDVYITIDRNYLQLRRDL